MGCCGPSPPSHSNKPTEPFLVSDFNPEHRSPATGERSFRRPNLTSLCLGFSPIGRWPCRSWSQTLSLSNFLAPLPLLHGISSLKLYLGFPRFCLFCSFGSLLNLSASKRFVWNTKSLTILRNYPMTCLQISSHSLPFPYPPSTMSSLRNKIADTRWSLWMLYKCSIFSYRMDSIEWSTRALIFIILNRFNIWRKVFKYITLERKASWWNRDRGGEKARRACFCCVGGKVRKWSPSEL